MDYIETQPVRAALPQMYPQMWSFHRKYFPATFLSAVAGRQRFAYNLPANTWTVSGV